VNSNESNAAPEVPVFDVRRDAKSAVARARWLVVLGGLLAGLVSFGIGEAIFEIIPTGTVMVDLSGAKAMVVRRGTSTVADARNGALTFAVLGLCLGGCLGLAGGLARRSTSGALNGGLVGSVLGIALGGGVSLALLARFISMRLDYFEYDLLISLVMHGLIWGLLGAAAGLAYAVGLGELRLSGRAVTAGLVGAVLGAVAFELIGAVFFDAAETDQPISETWPTRLLARLLVTVGTAVAIALLLPDRQKTWSGTRRSWRRRLRSEHKPARSRTMTKDVASRLN
jgi:hypothetical protein